METKMSSMTKAKRLGFIQNDDGDWIADKILIAKIGKRWYMMEVTGEYDHFNTVGEENGFLNLHEALSWYEEYKDDLVE